jgi:hypothetical protein
VHTVGLLLALLYEQTLFLHDVVSSRTAATPATTQPHHGTGATDRFKLFEEFMLPPLIHCIKRFPRLNESGAYGTAGD